jgi:hypothetical protein
MQELLRNTRQIASTPLGFQWVRSSSFPSAVKTLKTKTAVIFPDIQHSLDYKFLLWTVKIAVIKKF